MRNIGLPVKKEDRIYTYEDYRSWPEDERWEIIRGIAWNMSAAPAIDHQRLIGRLFLKISSFLEGKPCEALLSPVDVLFPDADEMEDGDTTTVVQPDIIVICDKSRIKGEGKYYWGPPELIVEVLSPRTSKKDLTVKKALYEENGVPEYWIVDPGNELVQVYRLSTDRKYDSPSIVDKTESLESGALQGLVIRVGDIFQFPV